MKEEFDLPVVDLGFDSEIDCTRNYPEYWNRYEEIDWRLNNEVLEANGN